MNTHGLTDFNQYCSHVININDLYLMGWKFQPLKNLNSTLNQSFQ